MKTCLNDTPRSLEISISLNIPSNRVVKAAPHSVNEISRYFFGEIKSNEKTENLRKI